MGVCVYIYTHIHSKYININYRWKQLNGCQGENHFYTAVKSTRSGYQQQIAPFKHKIQVRYDLFKQHCTTLGMSFLPQRSGVFIHQIQIRVRGEIWQQIFLARHFFQLRNEMSHKSSLMRKAFSATVIANYYKEIGSCRCPERRVVSSVPG